LRFNAVLQWRPDSRGFALSALRPKTFRPVAANVYAVDAP
jgi:hypothetical protein